MANAMFSVIVLMMVTRSLDNESADIFSIAWSISQLMYTIGTFQIRTYQATDITEKFNFKQYLEFRLLTILFMMISSILYVNIKQYDIYKSAIVIIICLYKAIDALADVYEGWFQQKERLDLAGKAVVWKIVIGVISFGGALYISGNLLVSCAILFRGYTSGFFCLMYCIIQH